jgi:hypothetical protein
MLNICRCIVVLLLGGIPSSGCQPHPLDANTDELAPASAVSSKLQIDVSNPGPDRLRCGPDKTCDARTTYCEAVLSDVEELPSDFTCRPLPVACAAKNKSEAFSCACLPQGTRCRHFCVVVDTGGAKGLRLTCVGGA